MRPHGSRATTWSVSRLHLLAPGAMGIKAPEESKDPAASANPHRVVVKLLVNRGASKQ
jgi:hypothetical protein